MDSDRFACEFARLALDYYIAARASARAGVLIVTANLFHHAIEMLLKSELARSMSPGELKGKFGHKLASLWTAFKLRVEPDLSEFDALVADLDKFERIRYPDNLIDFGARIQIGFGQRISVQEARTTEPEFLLSICDVDRLFAAVFRASHWNHKAFRIPSSARDTVEYLNPESRYWIEPHV